MKNYWIRKDIDVERRAATVISELVIIQLAIVGVKIYQQTKVINELSSDRWRRRNHKWLELPARPPYDFDFKGISLQLPRNSYISLGL